MRRWRLPFALSAAILAAQLFHINPLFDVVSGDVPGGVRLSYPLGHVVFAPFTLTADWLNGGSIGDLIGFAVWALLAFAAWRIIQAGRTDAPTRRRLVLELVAAVFFLASFGLFIWWGARWDRPIPRLVADDSSRIIFDIHSHTSASHDGRPGFGVAANARWHERAGFDAAFVTDHNVFGQARQWQLDRAGKPPRLLNGEELSLSGLHMIALGTDSLIRNKPWDATFDSSLALLRLLGAAPAPAGAPYLIASLPEYARNHWGPDLGRVVSTGVRGLEIWTTSPKAMDFPPDRRREVIARARSLGLALFGATDMHGLGNAATVWNVASLPGWRGLDDTALTAALLDDFRREPAGVRVLALRRRIAPTRGAQAVGTPLGLVLLLRTASPAHAVALLGWVWAAALLRRRRI